MEAFVLIFGLMLINPICSTMAMGAGSSVMPQKDLNVAHYLERLANSPAGDGYLADLKELPAATVAAQKDLSRYLHEKMKERYPTPYLNFFYLWSPPRVAVAHLLAKLKIEYMMAFFVAHGTAANTVKRLINFSDVIDAQFSGPGLPLTAANLAILDGRSFDIIPFTEGTVSEHARKSPWYDAFKLAQQIKERVIKVSNAWDFSSFTDSERALWSLPFAPWWSHAWYLERNHWDESREALEQAIYALVEKYHKSGEFTPSHLSEQAFNLASLYVTHWISSGKARCIVDRIVDSAYSTLCSIPVKRTTLEEYKQEIIKLMPSSSTNPVIEAMKQDVEAIFGT